MAANTYLDVLDETSGRATTAPWRTAIMRIVRTVREHEEAWVARTMVRITEAATTGPGYFQGKSMVRVTYSGDVDGKPVTWTLLCTYESFDDNVRSMVMHLGTEVRIEGLPVGPLDAFPVRSIRAIFQARAVTVANMTLAWTDSHGFDERPAPAVQSLIFEKCTTDTVTFENIARLVDPARLEFLIMDIVRPTTFAVSVDNSTDALARFTALTQFTLLIHVPAKCIMPKTALAAILQHPSLRHLALGNIFHDKHEKMMSEMARMLEYRRTPLEVLSFKDSLIPSHVAYRLLVPVLDSAHVKQIWT